MEEDKKQDRLYAAYKFGQGGTIKELRAYTLGQGDRPDSVAIEINECVVFEMVDGVAAIFGENSDWESRQLALDRVEKHFTRLEEERSKY